MDKIWFILINEESEGPKSYEDLKNDSRLTPDSWVWKDGFHSWKKIRDVEELKNLFKDDSNNGENSDIFPEVDDDKKPMQDELAIDMQLEPPYFLWVLFALIVTIYVLLQVYR